MASGPNKFRVAIEMTFCYIIDSQLARWRHKSNEYDYIDRKSCRLYMYWVAVDSDVPSYCLSTKVTSTDRLDPLLLTWINFNPSMDK